MGKNSGITADKLKLIAAARNYVIDVVACGVAAGMPGLPPESITARREKLAKQEVDLIAQIEKIDGDK